jgi:hypothetical protein
MTTLYKYSNFFEDQPLYFEMLPCQRKALIASFNDVLLVDMTSKKEIDIDEMCLVQDIRQVTVGEDEFYILANKRNRVLGKYLLSMNVKDFENLEVNVLISRNSKLDIADAQLFLIESD